MSIEARFGNDFKSEIKSSGAKLVAQEKVAVASGSDTSIQAFVRLSPPSKVRLTAEGVGSPTFVAECSCPVAQKSQFCKHVWATLLCVEEKYPDFLSEKRNIQKPTDVPVAHSPRGEDASAEGLTTAQAKRAESQAAYKAASKVRAADYRKAQYEKQKLRAKAIKKGRSASSGRAPKVTAGTYPEAIRLALAYFEQNGFPMADGPSETIMSEARRKLSRVFHPDKGGTHEEVAELNHYCDLIEQWIR